VIVVSVPLKPILKPKIIKVIIYFKIQVS